ncbi:hypothetical protein [Sphingomonas sp.]|uniref:hypothetical protein n=1 Tax=Sphingomonas sp. TaxID=28214 RepID=UPI001B16B2CE|nr:hypothetical protein [Sphingomonas sp.]MBO9711745.1 hypothetical protein [Sphingomonas sp.]
MPASNHYSICGLRFASEVALPSALDWNGDAARPIDVVVRIGAVPGRLPDAVYQGPTLQVDASGAARHEVPSVAAFLIRGGREIVVAPAPHAAEAEVRLFLLATPVGILFHQRGLLPLHASAVAIGDRAIAFAGMSGAGKSTFAAALEKQGGTLLADDMTVIDLGHRDGPMVLPAFAHQKLCDDAIDALGLARGEVVRASASVRKFYPAAGAGFAATPRRLMMICHLGAEGPEEPWHSELAGARAVHGLREHVFRPHAAGRLGLDQRLLIDCGRLASQVRQIQVARSASLASLPALAQRLAYMLTEPDLAAPR